MAQTPVIRLLRSIVRAGKVHQKTLTKLFSVSGVPAGKSRKPRPATASKKGGEIRVAKARAQPPTGPSPAPGKWMASHYPMSVPGSFAGTHRIAYWLYIPERVPDAIALRGWPLVVMLHGCRQTATQFAQGTRMNQLAESKGFAVLYPQQAVTTQAQRCWHWYSEAAQHGEGEVAVLASLIHSVKDQYAIDPQRIYACGISAGAGMAAILALNYPELIAAVGLHSAPVYGVARNTVDALKVMRHGAHTQADEAIRALHQRRTSRSRTDVPQQFPPMPAILVQGAADNVVHPDNQEHLARQWIQLNGMSTTAVHRLTIKPAAHGRRRNAQEIRDYRVGRKVLLRVVRIVGLGHAWSGGDPAFKFNAGAGPDASRMMVDFFSKHRR
jgi:poly(hydroxyalkanoate) depolymerase family esterase